MKRLLVGLLFVFAAASTAQAQQYPETYCQIGAWADSVPDVLCPILRTSASLLSTPTRANPGGGLMTCALNLGMNTGLDRAQSLQVCGEIMTANVESRVALPVR